MLEEFSNKVLFLKLVPWSQLNINAVSAGHAASAFALMTVWLCWYQKTPALELTLITLTSGSVLTQ